MNDEYIPESYTSDVSLVALSRGGDKTALDNLMQRFKPLVKAKVKDYYLVGGDLEDLIQEGMIGLYKAVLDFNPGKNASFAAFASLCVVRQIQTAIKAAGRQKHMPLNTSLSLHSEIPNSGDPGDSAAQETYMDKIPDHRTPDPEAQLLGSEAYKDIDNFIRNNLSELEYKVLMLHMEGKTHLEIAEGLNKNAKSIDNTIQRIRRKIGKGIRG